MLPHDLPPGQRYLHRHEKWRKYRDTSTPDTLLNTICEVTFLGVIPVTVAIAAAGSLLGQ